MERAEFESLVRRLEGEAQRNPGAYRRRVALLAALGYAYVFFILLLAVVPIGALVLLLRYPGVRHVAIKVGWILLVLVWFILRALWVRLDRPEGIELRREGPPTRATPRLFALIDELSRALQGPRFHHVLLTDDFNAAVAQHPRLGLLGWQVNYLLIGLPLIQALSPEQFRAVLAHEFGHLSGNHSRFSGWIYRVRRTWGQLLEQLKQQRHHGTFLFERFLGWYAPYFNAYSFVLARADEYVADRCAVEQAGARPAAEALIAVTTRGEFVEERYWPEVYRTADRSPEPPAAPFAALGAACRRPLPADQADALLKAALAEETGYADTHPCLAERLATCGFPVRPDGARGHLPLPGPR